MLPHQRLQPALQTSPAATPQVARSRVGIRVRVLALAGVLTSATVLFLYKLGASSFFLDEVFTWYTVRGDLSELHTRLLDQEVAPPLYYLFLHGWVVLTGAESEAALRLPSALAGVALVAAVYWLGSLIAGRRAGLVSAGLATVSPIVLLYAQQTRSYIFAMLAVTIAAAAAIEAVRGRSTRWLILAGAASAAGILTHYTAVLAVVPITAWVLMQDAFRLRTRLLFIAAVSAPLLAVSPLLVEQMGKGHHDWTEQFGRLDLINMLRIIGTPFDGRAADISTPLRQVGAVIVVDAIALLALAHRMRAIRERWLIAAAALGPIVVVLLTSALVHPVAITRYTAVAAPFVLIAIGAAAVNAPRILGAVLVTATLALSIAGVVAAERPSGYYPDTRATIAAAAQNWHKGDFIVSVGLLAFPDALTNYAERALPPDGRQVHGYATLDEAAAEPVVLRAVRNGGRMWLAADPPLNPAELARGLDRLGLKVSREWSFHGVIGIQLVLASSADAAPKS
jgi:mannosyltransferase